MKKKYKLIIFDLDGTFYDLEDVVSANYEMQMEFLMKTAGINRQKAEKLFQCNEIYPYKSAQSKSATEYFSKIGLNLKDWKAFREEHFTVDRIQQKNAVSAGTIAEFHKIASMIILSSNSSGNIDKVLRWLHISKDLFADILCSDTFTDKNREFCKKDAMIYAAEKFQVNFEFMLSIGDRYHTDIEPLLELGGSGILVESPRCLENILQDLHNSSLDELCNRGYQYYVADSEL